MSATWPMKLVTRNASRPHVPCWAQFDVIEKRQRESFFETSRVEPNAKTVQRKMRETEQPPFIKLRLLHVVLSSDDGQVCFAQHEEIARGAWQFVPLVHFARGDRSYEVSKNIRR